ncbi:hypothetical protein [Cedecea sp.]|jgi:hypothetical protein|uniref:MrpH family fimbial adhesin n=1 Tax=Cedecea sp. TaxID=1970739 RepID=UPI002F40D732
MFYCLKRWVKRHTVWLALCLPHYALAGNVDINWELVGSDLRYTITEARDHDAVKRANCGGILSGNQCFVKFFLGDNPYQPPLFNDTVNLRGSQSPQDILQTWSLAALPKSGVVKDWSPGNNYCFVLYIFASNLTYGVGNSCQGTMTPPPTEPPPPPLSCSLSGDIYLRHGVQDSGSVNGHTATSTAYVSCTRTATVNIKAVVALGGSSTVPLSSGLQSRLTVNGIEGAAGATLSVPGASGSNVTFKSTLITSGEVGAGSFNGTAVAILNIL